MPLDWLSIAEGGQQPAPNSQIHPPGDSTLPMIQRPDDSTGEEHWTGWEETVAFFAKSDPNMDRDAKYNALYNKACRVTEMLGQVLETYMANMNADDDYL